MPAQKKIVKIKCTEIERCDVIILKCSQDNGLSYLIHNVKEVITKI